MINNSLGTMGLGNLISKWPARVEPGTLGGGAQRDGSDPYGWALGGSGRKKGTTTYLGRCHLDRHFYELPVLSVYNRPRRTILAKTASLCLRGSSLRIQMWISDLQVCFVDKVSDLS